MEEDLELHMMEAESGMQGAIDRLKREFLKISTGKATPVMVKDLIVSYYGAPTPMGQVANVSASDSRTLVIQPWEKSMLAPIEKAIFEANLGVTPQNDGEVVRIIVPPLTEERRKKLAKQAKALSEDAKVSIRNSRRVVNDEIKKAVKNGYPEDAGKKLEAKVNTMTNNFTDKADQTFKSKESDIMTI